MEPTTWEGGLYVRFAECILRELGIKKKDGTPYAPATISKSLRDVRAGRHRRTHAVADLDYSHWSFSRLVDQYSPSFPPIIEPMDEPSKILVEIPDRETLQRFTIETHDHLSMGAMLVGAHQALEKGRVPPGCKLIEIVEGGPGH
jgi:hypothetical protein